MIYYATIDNRIGSADVLPEGAVKIPTKEEYKALLKDKQKGKKLVTVEKGKIRTYESPVYSVDGEELKERDPKHPLITEKPPETLHVPRWKSGKWTENESDQQRVERLEKEKEEARLKLKQSTNEALEDMTYAFPDGREMQVRPRDQGNIETAIFSGIEQKWIMKDNTTRLTTPQELQEALDYGIQEGARIWDKYTEELDDLMAS